MKLKGKEDKVKVVRTGFSNGRTGFSLRVGGGVILIRLTQGEIKYMLEDLTTHKLTPQPADVKTIARWETVVIGAEFIKVLEIYHDDYFSVQVPPDVAAEFVEALEQSVRN